MHAKYIPFPTKYLVKAIAFAYCYRILLIIELVIAASVKIGTVDADILKIILK